LKEDGSTAIRSRIIKSDHKRLESRFPLPNGESATHLRKEARGDIIQRLLQREGDRGGGGKNFSSNLDTERVVLAGPKTSRD